MNSQLACLTYQTWILYGYLGGFLSYFHHLFLSEVLFCNLKDLLGHELSMILLALLVINEVPPRKPSGEKTHCPI